MAKTLVIVESPTKAKTIAKFLPRDYVVESTVGHIRDLPNSAKEIPSNLRDQKWARLGVDVENNFEPLYVVPADKKKQVSKLRKLIKEASALYLATDEDREGESISWHLVELLKPRVPRRRLVFHEITKEAITEALENARDIDERLVQAQETRRILDRLYGYEVSPILWRKIAPRLSAGRVQSVAVRIIVDRERDRRAFVRNEYWDLVANFRKGTGPAFDTGLISLDGKRIATGKDFEDTTGKLKDRTGAGKEVILVTQQRADELVRSLEDATWKVVRVERKPFSEAPRPPFTTSTLQQEANRKLRFSARATMSAAQRLYENGFITYMRTDSTTLSRQALTHARERIEGLYGRDFLSPEPRQYRTTVKNAQEAHEAIRPAGDFLRPEEVRRKVGEPEAKLYELIWKRTMACQMADARIQRTTVQVSEGSAVFQASGKTILFPGYLRAYVEGADDPDAELADKERLIPELSEGDEVNCQDLQARSHSTQPPPRYTEASLVKELEANGVGRPSTYATIIDTILRRSYVLKQGNALVPTFTAFAVVKLLENFFCDLVDVRFTARMEDDLDEISLGNKDHLPYLKSFYFGNGSTDGLHRLIQREIDPRESCTLFLGNGSDGQAINVRIGRYGPYLERGEERAPIPADLPPDELTVDEAEELFRKGSGHQALGSDPETGKPVYAKVGRFGPYVQLGDGDGNVKPKMKSLLPAMAPETTTLQEALRLLSLPRALGREAGNDEEIYADIGRYGPYIKRGTETRSLEKPEAALDITLDEAVELLKQEKPKRGWRGRTAQPLRGLGKAAESGADIKVMKGRYGPYVTDGTTNAAIPKGRNPEEIELEEALTLIRARQGAKATKKTAKKSAKKTAKKSAKKTAKKSAKKTAKKTRKKATQKAVGKATG